MVKFCFLIPNQRRIIATNESVKGHSKSYVQLQSRVSADLHLELLLL
jgi:hypothetical protein